MFITSDQVGGTRLEGPLPHPLAQLQALVGHHLPTDDHPFGAGGSPPPSSHGRTLIWLHLSAYNEAQVIVSTISTVREALSAWRVDFEIIVVNDGSTDRTGAMVAALAARDPRIRLVTHAVNQGYGAALVSGFAAATWKSRHAGDYQQWG